LATVITWPTAAVPDIDGKTPLNGGEGSAKVVIVCVTTPKNNRLASANNEKKAVCTGFSLETRTVFLTSVFILAFLNIYYDELLKDYTLRSGNATLFFRFFFAHY